MAERGFREKLGESLKSARQRAGFTQAGLANRLGISRPAVASIEAGRQAISVDQLVDIATLLDVSPTDVLSEALGKPGPASAAALEGLSDKQRGWILKLKIPKKGKE